MFTFSSATRVGGIIFNQSASLLPLGESGAGAALMAQMAGA
ncbi:hypothetical protein PAERUG_P48_London_17_VIM_2_01_13_00053 [Pseudomonas aeruginosa]|nr:hypothetical protein PAERUG_P48_London_17_VIM_2_01_13_00053 [Pseudomonas aeruginosa]